MAGTKDRLRGKLTETKGRAKRAIGKATGNRKLQTKGAVEQVKGKARSGLGKSKTAASKAGSKVRAKAKKIRS